MTKIQKSLSKKILCLLIFIPLIAPFFNSGMIFADSPSPSPPSCSGDPQKDNSDPNCSITTLNTNDNQGQHSCGSGDKIVYVSIDLGCTGKIPNPILDATFGIIHFLTIGVGVVITGSLIFAGIQYSAAGGDPQNTAKAKKRISNTILALIIFIFSYAILNYVVPGTLLK